MKANCIIIVILCLIGCSTNNIPDSNTIKGCLSSRFYDKNSEKEIVIRATDGDKQILGVKTPIGMTSSIIQQFNFTIVSFEKLVNTPEETSRKYGILSYCFPQKSTWKGMRKYLKPNDEIILFSGTDSGFVVIRSNHLFCMVVTHHSH